jgi:hypothetical protein
MRTGEQAPGGRLIAACSGSRLAVIDGTTVDGAPKI